MESFQKTFVHFHGMTSTFGLKNFILLSSAALNRTDTLRAFLEDQFHNLKYNGNLILIWDAAGVRIIAQNYIFEEELCSLSSMNELSYHCTIVDFGKAKMFFFRTCKKCWIQFVKKALSVPFEASRRTTYA